MSSKAADKEKRRQEKRAAESRRQTQESVVPGSAEAEGAPAAAERERRTSERAPRSLATVSPAAKPLADEKLEGKVLKLVAKAKEQSGLGRGAKEVQKLICRGQKGVCVIGGDVSPLVLVAHFPVLCERRGVPYLFLASKKALGVAAGMKQMTGVVLIKEPEESSPLRDDYAKIYSKAEKCLDGLRQYYVTGSAEGGADEE